MLPGITNVSQNCRERYDLRLVGKIENAVNVQHVQKLRRLHKSPLYLRFVLPVRFKRQIQQGIAIT